DANRDMNFSKMLSMMAVGFTLILLYTVLNSHFNGRIVARLPFEPYGPVRSISYRSLEGNYEPSDCSFALIYILGTIAFKANLQKILGFALPKTPGTGFWPQ